MMLDTKHVYRVQISDDAPACSMHRKLLDAALVYAEHRANGDTAEVTQIIHPLRGGQPWTEDATDEAVAELVRHLENTGQPLPAWLRREVAA